jgi:hypothetical protein
VRLREVAGQDFVMYERSYAPGFHDLMYGIFRDASIAPNVSQTAVEIPNADLTGRLRHGYHHCAVIGGRT